MAAQPQPKDALDRVQSELNKVLEFTGRVFAASKNSSRGTAIATSARLKQILPAYVNNYHAALDELDQQLHFAKLVMRRDLALANEISENELAKAALLSKPSDKSSDKSSAETATDKENVVEVSGEAANRTDASAIAQAERSTDAAQANHASSNSQADRVADKENSVLTSNNDVVMDDATNATGEERTLDQIDTTNRAKSSDKQTTSEQNDAALDTAFSTDMDSLFNDPASAGGLVSASANTDNADLEFTNTANSTTDFNFADFNADIQNNTQDNNGDVSGLVPAFSDNNDGDNDPDFSALFGPPANAGESQSKNGPDGATSSNDQQDFNFDDMMEFDIITDNKDSNNSVDNTNDFDLDFI